MNNLPGMVNPGSPYRDAILPWQSMEPFYLNRIQVYIREARETASNERMSALSAMAEDGLDPYGKDAALARSLYPFAGFGLYIAIERDAGYGAIRSHSRVGNLESIKRYAAIRYACARDSRNDRGGYDIVISGYSLDKHRCFPLSPGRPCPCEQCDDKRAIKAERPLRLRRAALKADLGTYDALPRLQASVATELAALSSELRASRRARDTATAERKRAEDAKYQAERKRNPSGLDILRSEGYGEQAALDLDKRLGKAYR